MNHIDEFRDRLKELMELNGETVISVSAKTGITNSRIYAYLNEKSAPNLNNALLIADYFLCSLDYLFGFCDDYEKKQRAVVASVNERLKLAIDNCGKTRYRIARDSNIHEGLIHVWYHGKKTPILASLVNLVEPLNTSLEFLAGRE